MRSASCRFNSLYGRGQQSIYNRLPKRGFKPRRNIYSIINVDDVQCLIEAKKRLCYLYKEMLHKLGFIKSIKDKIKLLNIRCARNLYFMLILCQEHRLRVFENRVLRRIFGPKRDEVTGGWRKLHNEELHGLYSSPSIVRMIKARRMRWAGHVARLGEMRGAYNILVGRPEGRRPPGRPRRRWEDNIKMDLREIVFGDVYWIHWA
jgi:hypothetical protein